MLNKQQQKTKRHFCVIALIIAIAAVLLFLYWCADKMQAHFISILLAVISLAAIVFLAAKAFCAEHIFARVSERKKYDYLRILCFFLITRIVTYLLGFLFFKWTSGAAGGFFENLAQTWRIGYGIDAPSYLGIAENGYVTEGDALYHLVFLPFFPVCIKLISLITGEYFAAGFIVANLCSAGACIMLYELVLLDHERTAAMRAVRYMLLMPAAFFYAVPMTEALFMLLSVSCIYCARKKRIWAAAVLGALAAFTRIQGILLAVPLAFEYYRERQANVRWWIKHIAAVGVLGFGVLGYLAINYKLYGNSFQFMIFQREHWSQGFNLFFDTVHYETEYLIGAIANNDMPAAMGLYLPCIVSVLGALAVMLLTERKMRRSYVAYFVIYFVISIGSAWLLSAPRYLLTAFPLLIGLAAAVKHRAADIALSAGLVLLQCAYLWMFTAGYPIY